MHLEGAEFKLEHKGNNCSVCGGDATIGGTDDTLTATSDENGIVSFTNIPSGHEYILSETKKDGYEALNKTYDVVVAYDVVKVFDGEDEITLSTIENTPEYIDITGTKTWDDSNNYYGTRPESIELDLYKSVNGSDYTYVEGVEPTWDEWTFTYNNLPKAENGHLIQYSVEEVDIQEGYEVYYESDSLNIENKLIENPSAGKLRVRKEVTGNDGSMPGIDEEYNFNLYVKVGLDAREQIQAEIERLEESIKNIDDEDVADLRRELDELEDELEELLKNSRNSVEDKINDLKAKLAELENSEEKKLVDRINYLKAEKTIIEGSLKMPFLTDKVRIGLEAELQKVNQELETLKSVDVSAYDEKVEAIEQSIKNLLTINVDKVEEDIARIEASISEVRAEIKAQADRMDIEEQIENLKNINEDINAKITVKFMSEDGTEVEKFELDPSSDMYNSNTKMYTIPFELLRDMEYEIEIFANRNVDISYAVEETEYPEDNYNKTFIKVNDGEAVETEGYKTASYNLNSDVTNTITFINDYYRVNVTSIRGLKVWSDNSNKFNTRPDNVTLQLTKTVEGVSEVVEGVTPNWANRGNKSDVWMWEFTELPLYNEDGKLITYNVSEIDVDSDYSMKQEGNVIVNKLEEGNFEFDVEKNVTDKNNAAPADDTEYEFNVNIKATNVTKETVREQLEILKDQLNDLNKIDEDVVKSAIASLRERIEKLVEDIRAGKVTAEELKAYKEALESKIAELRKIKISEFKTKVAAIAGMIAALEDAIKNNQISEIKANYQEEINMIVAQIQQLQNMGLEDLKVDGATLVNQAELLKYMFSGVNETLTVKFVAETEGLEDKEYTLSPSAKNKYYDATTKSYNIPFKLKANDKYTIKVEADRNLDIKYSVEETKYTTANYNKTIVDVDGEEDINTKTEVLKLKESSSPSIVFTNDYYQMATKDIEGTKVWEDESDRYKVRPQSVELQLTRTVNGVSEVVEGVTPIWTNTDSDEWNWEFTNLPKYTDNTERTEIEYSVREINVDKEYTMTQSGNVITNTIKDETVIGKFDVNKKVSGDADVRPADETEYMFNAKIMLPIIKEEPRKIIGANGEEIEVEGATRLVQYPITIKLTPIDNPEAQTVEYNFTIDSNNDNYDEETNTYSFEFALKKDTGYTVEVISDREITDENNQYEFEYAVTEVGYERANYINTFVSVNGQEGVSALKTTKRVLNSETEDSVLFINVYGERVVPTTNPPLRPNTPKPTVTPSPTPSPTPEASSTPEPTEVPVEPTENPLEPSEEPSAQPTIEPTDSPAAKGTKKPSKGEKPASDEKHNYSGKVKVDKVVKDDSMDDTPGTSDDNNLMNYYGLLIISALGLTFMVIVNRKRILNK